MGIKHLYFERDVVVSGTPERLVLPANEIYARYFTLQAKPTNTGNIIVGDEASILLGVGHVLIPGMFYTIDTDQWNTSKAEVAASEIWLDAESNSGDGVIIGYPYSDDKYLDP
jgi:hypothetical protein